MTCPISACDDHPGDTSVPTNLDLASELVEEVLRLSGEATAEAAVAKALEEFIARRQPERLLELAGQLEWNPDSGYKAERTRREDAGGTQGPAEARR